MRTATPAITQYVAPPMLRNCFGGPPMSRPRRQSAPHSAVAYASSPLLASLQAACLRTLFIVGCIGVAFCRPG